MWQKNARNAAGGADLVGTCCNFLILRESFPPRDCICGDSTFPRFRGESIRPLWPQALPIAVSNFLSTLRKSKKRENPARACDSRASAACGTMMRTTPAQRYRCAKMGQLMRSATQEQENKRRSVRHANAIGSIWPRTSKFARWRRKGKLHRLNAGP